MNSPLRVPGVFAVACDGDSPLSGGLARDSGFVPTGAVEPVRARYWFGCICSLFTVLLMSLSGYGDDTERPLSTEHVQFFEAKIRPVLIEHCYRCHSADGQSFRGGLGVDHRDALLAGGESGPAIVPGNLEDSLLWNAITYRDYRMPPSGRLPAAVLDDFKTWIEMGAPDPRVHVGVVVHSKVTAEDIEAGRKLWAYTPPVATPTFETPFSDWATTEIDRHVALGWQKNHLQPAATADPQLLVRRISFDLVGLPPSIAQRQNFMARWAMDPDRAVSELVDALLETPQFGERWGRHWLDVARYAETSGKEAEVTFPNAWRYRDYVIRSFNADKPYDRFIQEQIAGDLLPIESDAEWNENLIATGFLAIGPKSLSEQNPRQFQADLIDEQIDTTTRVVMGISVGCARCHDHKFDPIPQTDYYALAGIFQSSQTLFGGVRSQRNRQPSDWIALPVPDTQPVSRPIAPGELAELKKELEKRQQELAEARRAQRNGTQPNPRSGVPQLNVGLLDQLVSQLTSRIQSVDANGKPIALCMGVQDRGEPRNAKLLVRGEIDQPAQEIQRGFIQVISPKGADLPGRASGRLQLAQWMTSTENPLTARVMVNRIWQHLIGKGLVREPDNFGVSGPPPTHPELLDHLALEFMQNGWSIKHMIRTIANSNVYRLSSQFDANRLEADPENRWIARGNVKRLDAESIRDAMLSVSGQLELNPPLASPIAAFGSTVMGPNGPAAIPIALLQSMSGENPPDALRNLLARNIGRNGAVNPLELPNYHRSVYLPVARNSLPRALDVFDFAEPSLVVGEREVSNTAEQALYMLNNPFVLELSDAAARLVMQSSKDQRQRIVHAFQIVFGRDPSDSEITAANRFFRKALELSPQGKRDTQRFQMWSQFCQALFGSAEFRILN
jgi:hypothetical protein